VNTAQVHYTVTNTTPATLRLIIDNIGEAPTKLDLASGDRVMFPIAVPQGYNIRVSKTKTIKTIDYKGNNRKLRVKKFYLIPH
jgi:hypothetical protein